MNTLKILSLLLIFVDVIYGQSNVTCTSVEAENVLLGNYNSQNYAATIVIDHPDQIICDLSDQISNDSLLASLVKLESFYTRHTYSTTTSNTIGIGAARRWVYQKFQDYSTANENRLIPAYLQFDLMGQPCGDGIGFRNVLAVLPGRDTINPRVIIIQAHMDSRCSNTCDSTCYAPGIEDNASGTALVMEMARVMSQYTFNHTLVFMLTVGEEEGLLGGDAMAKYCEDNMIDVKAVQNNDIVGGILCGNTSSVPSCPGLNHVDSLQVRLFSNGSTATPNRNFARTIKMWYEEKLQGIVNVPMTISVMPYADRIGRGGDHLPFSDRGFRSMRFTAANEHGNADATSPGYMDRQHTSTDILGIDTDGDLIIDSLFVDLNYLNRNTVINGMSLTMLALGSESPDFSIINTGTSIQMDIQHDPKYIGYRVGVRRTTGSNIDFDGFYSTTDTLFDLPGLLAGLPQAVCVAGIDSNNNMTPFSAETVFFSTITTASDSMATLSNTLACNYTKVTKVRATSLDNGQLKFLPNPFTSASEIEIQVPPSLVDQRGMIRIVNIQGQIVDHIPVHLYSEQSLVSYQNELSAGVYFATLSINGTIIDVVKIIVL